MTLELFFSDAQFDIMIIIEGQKMGTNKIIENKLGVRDICIRLNRFSIPSLLEATFEIGLVALDSHSSEMDLRYVKSPSSAPWNTNLLFNLCLTKNFKQPERDISRNEIVSLLAGCWENFNITNRDINKTINSLFFNELIFQQDPWIYLIRNYFFLVRNSLNENIEIVENPAFGSLTLNLLFIPHFIRLAHFCLEKRKTLKPNIFRGTYLDILHELGVLSELSNDFGLLKGEISQNCDELDTMLSLSPLFNWPIVKFKEIAYIPCPYMIITSTTYSLINRISFGIDKKEKILSKTMENYVWNIIKEDPQVSDSWPEFEYKVKKNVKRTTDVIFRIKNKIFFCECKLKRASNPFRQFKEEQIDKLTSELADDLFQTYKCVLDYKTGAFSLGSHDGSHHEIRMALIVMESLPPFLIHEVLRLFKEILETKKVECFENIVQNIIIITLYDLESECFYGYGVEQAFKITKEKKKTQTNEFLDKLDEMQKKSAEDLLSTETLGKILIKNAS